jgi:hypothetical protein
MRIKLPVSFVYLLHPLNWKFLAQTAKDWTKIKIEADTRIAFMFAGRSLVALAGVDFFLAAAFGDTVLLAGVLGAGLSSLRLHALAKFRAGSTRVRAERARRTAFGVAFVRQAAATPAQLPSPHNHANSHTDDHQEKNG